jgi:hypothetical protein
MPIDDITQLHPVIENKLERASVQYSKKQEQSKLDSAKRRKAKNVPKIDTPKDIEDEINFELEMLLDDMKTSFYDKKK